MTDHTEAETITDARRDLLSSLTGNTARPSTWESAVMDVFEETVRAPEREKVRALIEGLMAITRCHCATSSYADKRGNRAFYTDHTADCLWVEARLWLARGEVPE